MVWSIPAKTFLLGEYAVLANGPALILTTSPCFKISMVAESSLSGIHPESPAGKYWTNCKQAKGLSFYDPYHGLGGMGASSAQFIGAYLASLTDSEPVHVSSLLETYFNYAWNGKGLCPSGYD
ncbi:hypothetical protein, partial [Alicyclobacillus cellulosilyticus]